MKKNKPFKLYNYFDLCPICPTLVDLTAVHVQWPVNYKAWLARLCYSISKEIRKGMTLLMILEAELSVCYWQWGFPLQS